MVFYLFYFYFGLTCVRTCIFFPLTLIIYQADSMSPPGYLHLWTNIRATSIA
jgi:hypothetical protein